MLLHSMLIEKVNEEVKADLAEKCGKVCVYTTCGCSIKAENGVTNPISISAPSRAFILQETILCAK